MLLGPVLVLVFVLSAAALSASRPAARSTPNLPATPYRYADAQLPPHFMPFDSPARSGQAASNYDNTPPDNPLTDDGATLGRVLFYDTRLSANGTTSCGSCHVQAHAFADPKPFSRGFHGARTDRRAMPLVNVRYYQRARFFWDERAGNLEEMVLLPIQSRIEMGQDLRRVVDMFAHDAIYPVLFARAFGNREITEERIGAALAQFVRSIVSCQSRYDDGRARAHAARDDFDNFTLQENRGKALFMRNCSTCHMKDGNEHFFVSVPANTRLRAKDPAADGGVGDVTLRAADFGSFKSPSLRNVEVTAPYGHDGRFSTLDAVIDHYSDNAISNPSLGYMAPLGPLHFTVSEKAALIAFLKTLTDRTFLTDPRFSNPFESKGAAERVKVTFLTARAALMGAGDAAGQRLEVLRSAVNTEKPAAPLPPGARSPYVQIERLLFFDRNADHRLSRDELPERMQGLLARADRNADAVLDPDEIRSFVNRAETERIGVFVRLQPFDGLPGVINDLKLPPAKHGHALALVSVDRFPRRRSDVPSSALLAEMRALLDDEEYQNFVAAAARLQRMPQSIN
jgi:cytochrome c peroxidase